ncbi:MAG TPA: hypothetical protein VF829_03255 [Candidatus Paceibacterota bacterium]
MGLDYSQKRLVSAPMRGRSKHAKQLRLYAVLTGLMSMLVTLADLLVALRK